MLIPAHRLLEAAGPELQKVFDLIPASHHEASSQQALANAVQLLLQRERQGAAAVKQQFARLQALLQELQTLTDTEHCNNLHTLLAAAAAEANLTTLEQLWLEAGAALETLLQALLRDTALSAGTRARIRNLSVAFETCDLAAQLGAAAPADAAAVDIRITREKLAAYLQDRLGEPDLQVLSLQPLSGGFGKETLLFSVAGQALSGEFVLRRDIGSNAGLDNDCHLIRMEYPVIKAVHARGFPAPEALWLDCGHRLLPGSDFMIMRRSPGTIGGNFQGAQTDVPPALIRTLAHSMAQLHQLPPMAELGDLNESIAMACWGLSRQDCTRRYIQGWYDFWCREVHTPSAALVSLYAWLLEQVPARTGTPALLHGDIGFHNFLLNDGALSVVLDWEFAHVGDPAEELAYVKITVGEAMDWDAFMAEYRSAGGAAVDARTLHYFMVWAYVRNASAANIIANRFISGRADDLKLSFLPYHHVPRYLAAANQLIEAGPAPELPQ